MKKSQPPRVACMMIFITVVQTTVHDVGETTTAHVGGVICQPTVVCPRSRKSEMQAAVKESGRLINDSTLVTGVLELPRAILNSLRIAYGPVAKNLPGVIG